MSDSNLKIILSNEAQPDPSYEENQSSPSSTNSLEEEFDQKQTK